MTLTRVKLRNKNLFIIDYMNACVTRRTEEYSKDMTEKKIYREAEKDTKCTSVK